MELMLVAVVPKKRSFVTTLLIVKTSKKEEDVESDGPRLNDKITSETVRLVSEEGHCIVTLKEALRRAKELKHDLVEVQRDAKPPVCKIVDYAHDKYKNDQVGKERAKAKRAEVTIRPEVKEIHFTPKIMRKSVQLLSTFLIVFIILSLGMMADAKKQCPYKIPISKKLSYCAATLCLADCKKQHGADASGSCSEEKGFCNCVANCKGSR
uniref:Translation initiation factor 3 N-terminal domain-containing protein n=1 Tax=Brassica oleracea var. oleracea TaxID=109376 RepID=A0A0D3BE38_BRAOL